MKVQVTDNEWLKNDVINGLRENGGYCPCIAHSQGKPEYKCWCKDFRENVPVGEFCHCMLFKKIEN